MSENIISCQQCSLASFCRPGGLNPSEQHALSNIASKQSFYERGNYLSYTGNPIEHLYVVRSGSFKAESNTIEGRCRILEFYLAGEIIGLDCISDNILNYDIVALEASSICEVSVQTLLEFAVGSATLQAHLFRLMSCRLANCQRYDPNSTAEERMASFLLSMSARHEKYSLCAAEFVLSMSRENIGNFLGLATETVSRVLQKFQESKFIDVKRRYVKLLSIEQLKSLANH